MPRDTVQRVVLVLVLEVPLMMAAVLVMVVLVALVANREI
jgi:hypothetical protein